MEAQPPSSAAAYPRWVMLQQYLDFKVEGSSCSAADGDDAKTLAAARTSAGHPIQVSLRFAEPPALSRVFLRIPDIFKEQSSKVLAAHGDSILIQVRIKRQHCTYTVEHFVYNAGAAAAKPPRPPSLWALWLLPPYYEKTYLVPRILSEDATGILRRGDDELVVAELWTGSVIDDTVTRRIGEIFLFRSGEWNYYSFENKDGLEGWDLPSRGWKKVVPIEDRLLGWVNMSCGGCVLVVDVFEEKPSVLHLGPTMDPHDGRGLNQNVCVTAGGGTLKFVSIIGRCSSCGAADSCECKQSRDAYTIHTWTMRIGNDEIEWVKDGMVDATELWALEAYKSLPCYPLDGPIVSTDDPEIICFRLRDGNRTIWQIMVNMRSKTIHSVSRHKENVGYRYAQEKLIPSNVSCFFNTLTDKIPMDNEQTAPAGVVDEKLIIDDDDSSNPMFEALREISNYGLGPDEVKAYRVLFSSGNGRRLTSLLRLPKDLRKNWLLMEIKASDAN